MQRNSIFLYLHIPVVHSSQVKSSLFSQPLFISEAVIFTTEKKKKKKVNVRAKSPKSGDYRAAE